MSLLDKLRCAIGRHRLTVWRVVRLGDGPHIPQVNTPDELAASIKLGAYAERHCKRDGCTYSEQKASRPRKPTRTANDGDTVTGIQTKE